MCELVLGMKSVVSARHVPFFIFMTVRFAKIKMSSFAVVSYWSQSHGLAHTRPSVYSLYVQKTRTYEQVGYAESQDSSD